MVNRSCKSWLENVDSFTSEFALTISLGECWYIIFACEFASLLKRLKDKIKQTKGCE